MSSTSSPKTKASMAWTVFPNVANIRSQDKVVRSGAAHEDRLPPDLSGWFENCLEPRLLSCRQSSGSATAPTDLRRLPRPLARIPAGFDPPRPRRGEMRRTPIRWHQTWPPLAGHHRASPSGSNTAPPRQHGDLPQLRAAPLPAPFERRACSARWLQAWWRSRSGFSLALGDGLASSAFIPSTVCQPSPKCHLVPRNPNLIRLRPAMPPEDAHRRPIVLVLGPTAGGKTSLSD